MTIIEEKIAKLTNQQALSILDSLAGEFAEIDTPEGKQDQALALQVLLAQEKEAIDTFQVAEADADSAGGAAREILLLMAQVPQIKVSLAQWLDSPPTQEAAAVPLVLAAPAVLSGCIAFLYVVGHVHFKRHPDGKWEVTYDPEKLTPLDKTMKDTISILAKVMRSMLPGK